MRDIYLGVHLPFGSMGEQDDSEDALMRLLGFVSRLNLIYRRNNPGTPRLYDTPVVYAKPDQIDRPRATRERLLRLAKFLRGDFELDDHAVATVLRLVRGVEEFLDIPTIYRRGKGDCNELAPIRIAELWEAGVFVSPYLTKRVNSKGGLTYHAFVFYPDGSFEDPSAILGMRSRLTSWDEEVRKNLERFGMAMSEAERLVDAGRLSPRAAADAVATLGLLPSSGRFAWSPYSARKAA